MSLLSTWWKQWNYCTQKWMSCTTGPTRRTNEPKSSPTIVMGYHSIVMSYQSEPKSKTTGPTSTSSIAMSYQCESKSKTTRPTSTSLIVMRYHVIVTSYRDGPISRTTRPFSWWEGPISCLTAWIRRTKPRKPWANQWISAKYFRIRRTTERTSLTTASIGESTVVIGTCTMESRRRN